MQYLWRSTAKSRDSSGGFYGQGTNREMAKSARPDAAQAELEKLLEILSACDRGVVEFSMGLYNVPHRDRAAMRRHNRRLHRALKSYLPQLLQPQQSLFELSDSR